MRVLVALMVSIMLCLQPVLSFDNESDNYVIVPFSSLQEPIVSDNWWEDTRMDKDRNGMHDMLDIALEQGKYVIDGKKRHASRSRCLLNPSMLEITLPPKVSSDTWSLAYR